MHLDIEKSMSVIEALELISPDSSRSTLRSWIKNRRVYIDGVVALREKALIEKGQEIRVEKKRQVIEGGVEVLFEDRFLMVVDKPAGLLSVATDFKKENTLHALLKRRPPFRPIFPVHRLDRDTSGVMVFAISQHAKEGLKEQFAAHQIVRRYKAFVEGVIKPDTGTWESSLIEDKNYFVKSTLKGGKRAITHYTVLERKPKQTLIELRLETGRKNQIRVHCSESNHPVVGDKKYGAQTNPFKQLCLHAALLEFTHPNTGKKLSFSSKITPKFLSL